MYCLRILLGIIFLALWAVPSGWAMFFPAKKPGGGGKHEQAFIPPGASQERYFLSSYPRKKLNLAEIYFRKPPLKGDQKEALKESALIIPEFKVIFEEKNGLPIFIKGSPLYREPFNLRGERKSPKEIAFQALFHLRKLMRLNNPSEEFFLKKKIIDKDGRVHLRFEQRWRGLRYFAKQLTVHLSSEGEVYLIEGRYAESLKDFDSTPQLSAREAAERVASLLGVPFENVYHTELVIVDDMAGLPHLAWLVEVSRGVERWRYFLDARLGQVIKKYRLPFDLAVPGSGRDEQTGQLHQFSVWEEGGTYFFIDTSLPIHTADPSVVNDDFGAGNVVILELPYGQLEYGINWLSSSDPNSWPEAAVSVWYGLKETLEYYFNVHGRRGMNGRGASAVGIIGLNQANAFYDGGQNDFMVFGIGDGMTFRSLTALDVIAHEFTHGVTHYTADLEYLSQSGALNEAFSDIFAAMVDRDDWLIGEDVVLVPPYNLRNLEDPHQSLQPQPATMDEYRSLPPDQDHGGVHINATIPAHTAYLIANTIGREKAERIFYKTLSQHLTPQSQFRDFCLALAQAAEELYGPNSQEKEACESACIQTGILQAGDGGGSEPPPPVPPLATDDYVLFFYLEPDYESGEFIYYLATLTPNGDILPVTERPVHPTRPAPIYYGGTQYVLFVDSNFNLWAANILSEYYEEYLVNDSGEIWSVATSPATPKIVYTSTRDENIIYTYDLSTQRVEEYEILLYPPDASSPIHTYFPDVVSLSLDGQTVFFDCFNRISFRGKTYEFWALAKLDLLSRKTHLIFPVPDEGVHIGNPSTAHTLAYLLAFDIWSSTQVETRSLNLISGRTGLIWEGLRQQGVGTSGWPSFVGDDSAIVLQNLDLEAGAEILIRVPIHQEGDIWVGETSRATVLPIEDPTGYGLIIPMVYRPGERNVNPQAEISPQILSFGKVKIGQQKTLSLTIRNVGNYPLEFRGANISGDPVFVIRGVHTTIPAGESYQLEVLFWPQEVRTYQATLKLYLSDPEQPEVDVPLSGEGSQLSQGEIVVDVRINGSDGPLTLNAWDTLNLTVSLDPKGVSGNGDYFLWAEIPDGSCYCYSYPANWFPCSCTSPRPAYQGNLYHLVNFPVYQVLCRELPAGDYIVHFAVDTNLDSVLNTNAAQDNISFTILKRPAIIEEK